MAIPMLIFKGFAWAKDNGQEEEYSKQYEEHFGVKFKGVCPICNKLKPPGDWVNITQTENGFFEVDIRAPRVIDDGSNSLIGIPKVKLT